MRPTRVSDDGRYFVDGSSHPVFWLGTTQWQLTSAYSLDDVRTIVERSRAHGFAFAQVMLLGVGDGTVKNVNGDAPWLDNDPLTPNEAYFKHVDAVFRIAEKNNLILSIVVYHQRYRPYTTDDKARAWAAWIARRYGHMPNIVWSMTPKAEKEFIPIVREIVAGLREGDTGRHLITFKPDPAPHPAAFLHDEPWLDYSCIQVWKWIESIHPMVTAEYNLKPTKPVLMGEGAYEAGSEYGFDVTPLWVRRQAYYSYLAGAHHAYGHNDSWRVLPTWEDALDAPGAVQCGLLKDIFTAIPEWWFLTPDQSVLTSGSRTDGQLLTLSARHKDGRWLMVYCGDKATFAVDLSRLAGPVTATWTDPRNAHSSPAGRFPNTGTQSFTTPAVFEDSLLVLEVI